MIIKNKDREIDKRNIGSSGLSECELIIFFFLFFFLLFQYFVVYGSDLLRPVVYKVPSGLGWISVTRKRAHVISVGYVVLRRAKKSVGNPGRPSNRYRNIPGVPMGGLGGWACRRKARKGASGAVSCRGNRGRRRENGKERAKEKR